MSACPSHIRLSNSSVQSDYEAQSDRWAALPSPSCLDRVVAWTCKRHAFLMLLGFALSFVFWSPSAFGHCLPSPILVTSYADSGLGTLREALADVCSPGEIDIPAPGTNGIPAGSTIMLSTAGDYTFGPSALKIPSGRTITINAIGNGVIIRRDPGVANLRLFYVPPTATLTLNNVTLQGGKAQGGDGGIGTFAAGGGAAGLGGGIFNEGNLTVQGVTLSGNVAQGGAGGGIADNYGGGGGGGLGGNGADAGWYNGGGGGGNQGPGGAAGRFCGNDGGSGGPTTGGPGGACNQNGGNGGIGGGGGGGGEGGSGGSGGFGGGGGGSGDPFNGSGGYGGQGGFGGGGGAGGVFGAGGFGAGNGATGVSPFDFRGGGGGGAGLGGAIFNNAGGTLTIANSTLTANSAQSGANGTAAAAAGSGLGGAIFNRNGTVTTDNVTIVGNTGGGIYNYQDLTLIPAATLLLSNTLLASTTAGSNCTNDGGTLTNVSHNLDDIVSCGFFSDNGSLSSADPKLQPLADNGGPTFTLLLGANSAAINAGDSTVCSNALVNGVDQRGLPRRTPNCDIGAFEAQPAGFSVYSGSPQTASTNTSFEMPLKTIYYDANSNPLAGVAVNYTAPASGPSATLSSATATTDANGIASVTATANSFVGSYQVVASTGSLQPLNFDLTNTSSPSVQVTIQSSPAGLLVSVDGGDSTAAPLIKTWNVGDSHTIATTSPQQGDTGVQYVWNNWSDSQGISHTITVPSTATTYTANFDTQFLLTTAANTGGTVSPASGSFYNAISSVPLTATASSGHIFAGWTSSPDSVSDPASSSTSITMNAPESVTASFLATTTISINNIPSGAAFGGSFTPTYAYTGDGTKSVTSSTTGTCTFNGTTVNYVGVGQCTLVAHATTGTNYAAATGSDQTFTIGQATPTVSWTDPADITYPAALSATQLNATASVAGTFTYTQVSGTVLNAGNTQALKVHFVPTDSTDYATPADTTVHINVLQATPTVSWSNPADITYPAALSATQLNATASVAGTFTYTQVSGTVLNAGNTQALKVHFVPTDSTDYATPADTTVHINVLQATPTVSWSNPADITYPAALSATQLNATASVAGTFTYTPASGTVLNAGNTQALKVHFAPTDSTDYATPVDTTVHINVMQATPTISINNIPGSAAFGGSFTPTYAYIGDGAKSVTSSTTGICTVTGTTVNYVGVGQCTLTAHATAGTNYAAATGGPQSFAIARATPTISINNIPSGAAFGGSFTPTYAYTGDGTKSVTSSTTGICTVTGGTVNYVGVGQCTLTAHATATTNSAAATGSPQSFTIIQATPTISINIPNSAVFGGGFAPTFLYSGNGKTSATSNTPGTCTVGNSGLVSYVGVGTCTLVAHAAATTNYAAATGSAQSFAIAQATATISIKNVPNSAKKGGSFIPTYNYNGDGNTSVTSSTTGTCSVLGGTVSFVTTGTCTLVAHATAGTNYKAADGGNQSFTIK